MEYLRSLNVIRSTGIERVQRAMSRYYLDMLANVDRLPVTETPTFDRDHRRLVQLRDN